MTERELTDLERRIVAFERSWWKRGGVKDQAVKDELGMSATRYYQLLGELIDVPAAMAFDPMLMRRLSRRRDARRRERQARLQGSSAPAGE